MYDLEAIKREIKKRLTPSRYEHSLAVSEYALIIAQHLEYDSNRAQAAALLHDIAREHTKEELITLAQTYHVSLSEFNRSYAPSLHGPVGAAMIEQDLGIHDKELLLAVRNHVTGRPGMCMLEKIIFLADHLARSMHIAPQTVFNYAKKVRGRSIDEAITQMLVYITDYEQEKGDSIDERTGQTFDWLIRSINKKNQKLSNTDYSEFDKIFDRVIEAAIRQKVLVQNVKNCRELGGYTTEDGHSIKKGRLLRSGDLHDISPEGIRILRSMDINYIIDLRSEKECRIRPDPTIPDMIYVNIPIVKQPIAEYSASLLKWYTEAEDQQEKEWIIAEFLSSIDMKRIYREIALDPDSQKAISAVLEIFQRDDCAGVLFHCSSGKDRTGIISGILLQLLKIRPEQIEYDYYMSAIFTYYQSLSAIEEIFQNGIEPKTMKKALQFLSIERSIPEYFFGEIKEKYETPNRYLREILGITDNSINKLNEKWIDHTNTLSD